MMRRLAAALLLGVLATLGAKPAGAAEPYALTGQPAPEFSAALAGGGAVTGAALRSGKWTVVEFWGLWCEDSLADLKYAKALARAIAQDPSLRFLTVLVDQRYGGWKSPEDFIRDQNVRFPIALDPYGQIERAFGVHATPTYLVIDDNGIIRAARADLRKETNPDGGVKTLIKQIAALKGQR